MNTHCIYLLLFTIVVKIFPKCFDLSFTLCVNDNCIALEREVPKRAPSQAHAIRDYNRISVGPRQVFVPLFPSLPHQK